VGQDQKRVYLLNPIFTFGRRIHQTLNNLCLYDSYAKALQSVNIDLESLFSHELDDRFNEQGLLAANLLESLATLEYPSWGYSLRPEVVEGATGFRYER
jgi:starch phosphorylase